MLRTVRTFVITCTIYLLIYCSPEQGNYLPFDAGYNWTYQYIVGDSPDTRTVVIEIPRQTTLQGHEVWEKVETQTINSTVTIDTSYTETLRDWTRLVCRGKIELSTGGKDEEKELGS
jgi:hypothetical protein